MKEKSSAKGPWRLGILLGVLLTVVPMGALYFQGQLNHSLDAARASNRNAELARQARDALSEATVSLWAYRGTGLDPYQVAFQDNLDTAAAAIPYIQGPEADGLLGDLSNYRSVGGKLISLIGSGDPADAAALGESADAAHDQLDTDLGRVIEAASADADTSIQDASTATAVLAIGVAVGMLVTAFIVFAIVGVAIRSTRRAGDQEAARREAEARQDQSERALELEREARERLEEAERIQRDFVGIVSHEFRTPLTSITGFVNVLRERWQTITHEERMEFLEIVDRQAKRLSRLVEDLLLAGKIQEHRVGVVLERIDMRQLLRETIEEEAPKAGDRHIAASVEPGAEYAVSDELRLRQVLVNLIDNSIKYSPPTTPITLRCWREDRDILLACEDEGGGIPADKAGRLMRKFTQGDPAERRGSGGVGLGLYIVRNLADAIGGSIELAEQNGRVTIRVRLPQRRTTDSIVAAGGPLLQESEPGDGSEDLIERWTALTVEGAARAPVPAEPEPSRHGSVPAPE